MEHPDIALVEAMADLALAAGALVMQHFGKARVSSKADGSPVTLADAQSEALIVQGLARLFPGVPVIAEEAAANGILPEIAEEFLLVDPLDGTREFISGSSDFTVNIGLVRGGIPVAGVIFAPATGRLWFSGEVGETCDALPGSPLYMARNRRTIKVRPMPKCGLIAVASRSHLDSRTRDFIATLPVAECRSAGSSLKFCLVAEGAADVYPRFSPTMEWDTCAGHAILLAAGGDVRAPDGSQFCYGKRDRSFLNDGFIALSSFADLDALRWKNK